MRTVAIAPHWQAFREAARALLVAGVRPERVTWATEEVGAAQLSMLGATAGGIADKTGCAALRVPRAFWQAGEAAACHRQPDAWPWLYRLLWRLQNGEASLMGDAADPDVSRVLGMARSVRRDEHKMHAFVRFKPVQDTRGDCWVAWFEPRHRIVRLAAPFFERRFPSMRWSILTPDESVHWDGERLEFSAGVERSAVVGSDAIESFWLTYYANTFNPARVRVRAMRAEMPVYYWRNLPEAAEIPRLLRDAPARVRQMIEHAPVPSVGAVETARDPGAQSAAQMLRSAAHDVPRDPPASAGPPRFAKIRVGVAGWDYPDWAGIVYPRDRAGVDRLRWVASRFDLIEINSTFYRPASEKAARGWLERTADKPHFRFAAKLPRTFTHARGPWSDADAGAARAGMTPLMNAGRLESLLVQFPWSFKNGRDERRRMQHIVRAFCDFPLHIEIRHDSWAQPEFYDWLRSAGVGSVSVDQPMFSHSVGPSDAVAGKTAYLRLHGRNAANWFREDASRDERYDYSYSTEELIPWVNRALRLANREDITAVDVVFNNHYRAQAVFDAETFARLLVERLAAPSAVAVGD